MQQDLLAWIGSLMASLFGAVFGFLTNIASYFAICLIGGCLLAPNVGCDLADRFLPPEPDNQSTLDDLQDDALDWLQELLDDARE